MKRKKLFHSLKMSFGIMISMVFLCSFMDVEIEKIYNFSGFNIQVNLLKNTNCCPRIGEVNGKLVVLTPITDIWMMEACDQGKMVNVIHNPGIKGKLTPYWEMVSKVPCKKNVKIKLKQSDLFYQKKEIILSSFPAIIKKQRKTSNRMVLINIDEKGTNYIPHGRSWNHLGFLHVGTVAEQEGFEVVIWDEMILGKANLPDLIKSGDIVGLSVVITGIIGAKEYAKEAKNIGASYVICGNDQASFRAQQMLRNECIDGIFLGDDLAPMRKVFRSLIQAGELPDKEISSFVRRENFSTDEEKLKPEYFVIPNLSLYSNNYWSEVWNNHQKLNGFEYQNPSSIRNSTILFAGGCTRGKNLCPYCSIYDAWNIRKTNDGHIRKLIETYMEFGINSYYSIADSMYEMTPVLNQIKNSGIRLPNLMLYARAKGIANNPKNIALLKEIVEPGGVLKFNIGLDSGDEWILRNGIRKGHGMTDQYKAISEIKKAGVHLQCSFVVGAPGESTDSCKNTLEFVEYLTNTLGKNLVQVEADFWWLNFGAPCSRVFYDYEYARNLSLMADKEISLKDWETNFFNKKDYLVVPLSTEKAWYKFFTKISYEEAEEYIKTIEQVIKNSNGIASSKGFFNSPREDTEKA